MDAALTQFCLLTVFSETMSGSNNLGRQVQLDPGGIARMTMKESLRICVDSETVRW